MAERTIVARGQVVFDRADIDAESDSTLSPLVVIDPNAGIVADQDTDTRNAIRTAERNRDYDTSDSAECADVVYPNMEFSDSTYTFPKDRLFAPVPSSVTSGWPPAVWAQADLLVQLYQELDVADIEALRAGIEGQVLLAARDIMLDAGITEPDSDDVVSTEELTMCPDCDSALSLVDSLKPGGEGIAFGHVRCNECGFEGNEEWVHKRTTRIPTDLP